uniref:GrpE protein homolog n=1 Tax=Loa loa TaxID=7209 RepID=A0A1I7VUN4_LOALO
MTPYMCITSIISTDKYTLIERRTCTWILSDVRVRKPYVQQKYTRAVCMALYLSTTYLTKCSARPTTELMHLKKKRKGRQRGREEKPGTVMIKRTCLTLLSTIRAVRIEVRTITQSNKRLLLKDNFPISTTRFSFSAAVQKEGANEASNFSLKHANARLTSAEFLTKVKESIGTSETGEDFVIPRPAFDALAAEYDILLDEVASFKDKYTRALAEVENVRRRGHNQTEEAKVFAIQGFCKDLLEVADILDLAVDAVKKEELDNNISLKNLFEGLEMTRTVLQKTFDKHGLKQISPEGEKFDPGLHEAVFQIPKDKAKFESGCVAQVVKIGYALQNRPIRAAKVGVVQ